MERIWNKNRETKNKSLNMKKKPKNKEWKKKWRMAAHGAKQAKRKGSYWKRESDEKRRVPQFVGNKSFNTMVLITFCFFCHFPNINTCNGNTSLIFFYLFLGSK